MQYLNSALKAFILILVCISTLACVVTYDTRTTRIEIMKPGIINFSENIKTVALINSVSNNQGYQSFTYTEHFPYTNDDFEYHETISTITDTAIEYRALSNLCLDALDSELKKEGYFSKVINYHDTLTNISPSNQELFNPEGVFQETHSDLCIFLDHIDFEIDKFKNFDPAVTSASLLWIFVNKKDSLSYTYKQRDTLIFNAADFHSKLSDNMKIKLLTENSARYFGQAFCSKIIPTWIPVNRIYFTSNNRDMLRAEKFALKNDWPKAAEIWNKHTSSKKSLIAAKACFNMALTSEMEGKLDEAINWAIRSSSIMKKKNEDLKLNCQKYIASLMVRKKEIEKLDKQIRN